MDFNSEIAEILRKIEAEARKIIGDSLDEIILFGSYARGEGEPESDLDVALLVQGEDDTIKKWDSRFTELMEDLVLEHEIFVSIMLISRTHFNKYVDALPFYMNINKEGKRVYERRVA